MTWDESERCSLVTSVRLDASAWNGSGLCKTLESWIDRQEREEKNTNKREQIHLERMQRKQRSASHTNYTRNKQLVQCTSQEIPYIFFSQKCYSTWMYHGRHHPTDAPWVRREKNIHIYTPPFTIADARRVGTKWWQRDQIQHFHSSLFSMQFQEGKKIKKEKRFTSILYSFPSFLWEILQNLQMEATQFLQSAIDPHWRHCVIRSPLETRGSQK